MIKTTEIKRISLFLLPLMLLTNSCTSRYYERLAVQQAETAQQIMRAAQGQLEDCKNNQQRMELMYAGKIDSLKNVIDSLKVSK